MFVTAVYFLFLLKLKWPKNKNIYDIKFQVVLLLEKFQMLLKNVKSLLEQLQVCILAEIVFRVRCTLRELRPYWVKIYLAQSNCRDLPHILDFLSIRKVKFEKDLALPIENFPSLVLPRNAMGCNILLFNLRSIICQVVTPRGLKTRETFKPLALKVVAVA